MAAFMHYWRMSEPRQFFDLEADEYAAMCRFMERAAQQRG